MILRLIYLTTNLDLSPSPPSRFFLFDFFVILLLLPCGNELTPSGIIVYSRRSVLDLIRSLESGNGRVLETIRGRDEKLGVSPSAPCFLIRTLLLLPGYLCSSEGQQPFANDFFLFLERVLTERMYSCGVQYGFAIISGPDLISF